MVDMNITLRCWSKSAQFYAEFYREVLTPVPGCKCGGIGGGGSPMRPTPQENWRGGSRGHPGTQGWTSCGRSLGKNSLWQTTACIAELMPQMVEESVKTMVFVYVGAGVWPRAPLQHRHTIQCCWQQMYCIDLVLSVTSSNLYLVSPRI